VLIEIFVTGHLTGFSVSTSWCWEFR